MDRIRHQKITDIVALALEMPADEVDTFLKEQCGLDHKLKEEVEALIQVDINESFLQGSALMLDAQESEPLEQVGRIKISRLLAKGGMGEVYEGEDVLLKRPVAVKIITKALRMSKDRRDGFLNEAQVLSSFQHPNICQVYDFFADGDRDVLVLELIHGRTLRQVLSSSKSSNAAHLNRNVALEMAREMTAALTAAHERGIVHRDFKPENIMVTPEGQVKVLDFGLARVDSSAKTPNDDAAHAPANLTTLSGTPGYMSPEQARRESATTATDVWSLGLVMVELLCGRSPFPKHFTSGQLIKEVQKGLVELPSSLPRAETRLLQRMLSSSVSERPSAREVLTEIERIQGRTRRRLTIAGGVLALAVITFSGWKYTSDLKREQQVAELARGDAENLVEFMLEDLHTDLRALGRLDLLEGAALQAMEYYGGLDSERMSSSQGKAAVGLIRVGEVLTDRGRKDEAMSVLSQSVDALGALHDQQPNDDLVTYRLGSALMMQIDILKTSGLFDLASIQAERAVDMGRQLTYGYAPGKGPSGRPTPEERWRVLLRSMYMAADINVRQGLSDLALPVLEEAAELAQPAAEVVPGLNPNLSDIHFKRCDSYNELGVFDKMIEACLAVMKLDKAILDSDPDNYELQKIYLGDYYTVARGYLILGRIDEAFEMSSRGVAFGQQMIEWEPTNVSVQNELAGNLIMNGRVLRAQGHQADSVAAFRKAMDLLTPLIVDREEITYMHHAFTALVYLGEFEQANELGWALTAKGFSRREFRELCDAHESLECGSRDE